MSLSEKINRYEKINYGSDSNINAVVFENAIDCIKYGYGFSYLNYYDLDINQAKSIWIQAIL